MSVGESHRTLREIVADEIRAMIMGGVLKPGERLFEDKLAEQLGVSRNPVREAIRALEAAGLVDVQPRRGAYVSQLDVPATRDLLELRSVLEAYAAELAAHRRTEHDLEVLRRCLVQGRQASQANDYVKAAACHREFHIAIERASQNRVLEPVVSPLRHQTELVFSMLAEGRGLVSWDEHERILTAIEAGQVDAARTRTFEHMSAVIEALTGRTEAEPPQDA